MEIFFDEHRNDHTKKSDLHCTDMNDTSSTRMLVLLHAHPINMIDHERDRIFRFLGRIYCCWMSYRKVAMYRMKCVLPSIPWHLRIVLLTLNEKYCTKSFDVSNIEIRIIHTRYRF